MIPLLVLAAYVAVIAGICRFLHNASGTDTDDYWPPEHGQLIAQVIREIAGQVEDMERLANTGELMAIVAATAECQLCGLPVSDDDFQPCDGIDCKAVRL